MNKPQLSVPAWFLSGLLWLAILTGLAIPSAAATTQKRYFAHEAVIDRHGVIAPWYQGKMAWWITA